MKLFVFVLALLAATSVVCADVDGAVDFVASVADETSITNGVNDDLGVTAIEDDESFVSLSTKSQLSMSMEERRVAWRTEVSHYVRLAGLPLNLVSEQEEAEEKQRGAGYKEMDPIMKKIDDLEKKVKAEQAEADKRMEAGKVRCAETQKTIESQITTLIASITGKKALITKVQASISALEKRIDESKASSKKFDDEIVKVFDERRTLDNAYKKRLEARLAEIATMRKANQLVCTFDKYKDTDFCKAVRNNALDIAEPKDVQTGERLEDVLAKAKVAEAAFEKKWEAEKKANEEAAKKGLTKPAPYQVPENAKSESLAEMRSRLTTDVESLLNTGRRLHPEVESMLKQSISLMKSGDANTDAALPKLMVELIQRLVKEQKNETIDYMESLRGFHGRFLEASKSIRAEGSRREDAIVQITSRNRQIDYAVNSINISEREQRNQESALANEKQRCFDEIAMYNKETDGRNAYLRNMDKLRSMLRVLRTSSLPKCPSDCTSTEAGKCIWKGMMGSESYCACNRGFYGDACEKKKCAGRFPGAVYLPTEAEACNTTTRGACQTDGTCKCNDTYYGSACEYKKCPGNGNCNDHGDCIRTTGACNCSPGFSGADCSELQCRTTNSSSIFVDASSALACNGRGSCDKTKGTCTCRTGFSGTYCEEKLCAKNCSDRGTCDTRRGVCLCNTGFEGSACEKKTCKDGCGGRSNGICNGDLGVCYCYSHASGVGCASAQQCETTTANWWSSFDHYGWSFCPSTMLMTGMYKNHCDGLWCIEEARCSKPCENSTPIALKDCYVADWVSSFDSAGWSQCRTGSYMHGLLRNTCSSLYCIEKAKCCFIDKGVWNSCTEVSWGHIFASQGWATVDSRRFMTGLYRDHRQDLRGIQRASACSFRRSSDPKAYA